MFIPFVQEPPQLTNTYSADRLLRAYLRRRLPPDLREAIEPQLLELGELAGGALAQLQRADRAREPTFTAWDGWGERIDRIELTALWREAERLAVRFGLTAIPYERSAGAWSRTHQFALVHLFHPVSDVYTCPLAMTDGAARTLRAARNARLIERALPHLTSRDPRLFWTSGQWMTESTGGSDVGASRTVGRRDGGGRWRLYGQKWFASAATSEGNPGGGRGLALFYVETRDAAGRPNGIRVQRLKDKLGTRKLPTAELSLDGTVAELVATEANGTRAIEPMLQVTRTWNCVCACAAMRHALGLAVDYAHRRTAFGAPLAEQPLHRETLAELEAEASAAFLLTFELVALLGREESGELNEEDSAVLRLLTPITKLATAKQAVHVVSEALEAFGGAGYLEDTGIPVLLRDTQVLPIWEGTTNVLSLDALLRADVDRGLAGVRRRIEALIVGAQGELASCARAAQAALAHATEWRARSVERGVLEAGARRFALTVARAFSLALLVEHAAALEGAGASEAEDAGLAREACRRFCEAGVDRLPA